MRYARLVLLFVLATPLAAQDSSGPASPTQTARDLVLARNPPATTPRGVPRGYALVVGISNYEKLDAERQLRFPESDAEAVYRILISPQGGAFPAENVKLLTGRQATLANIKRELEEWLPSVARPEDRVVVYFAGHGFVERGRGYLAPWDVDPTRLAETGYAMTALGEVLGQRVNAGWKVLLADACHSGKINTETTNENIEQQFGSLPSNFLTLTATTEREQSYEDPALSTGFGLFTYFIVQAFQGAADNDPCDGRITADELVEYVRSGVRRYARERQLTQTPTARGDYEPAMLLGVGQGCLNSSTGGATPRLGRAIVEANLDEVDLYIDDKLVGRLSRGQPLTVPSLSPGVHEFMGVKSGYEPDRQQITIAPDQDVTVTLRIRYVRQLRQGAADLNERGEALLFTRRSSLSLLNVLPIERRQSEDDLRRAADLFTQALAVDPNYGRAAYHLGQAQHLLQRPADAVASFKRAIAIDPGDTDARIECAAALIELGDADEAIRQLVEALRVDAGHDVARAMLARAYWDKAAWPQAIAEADRALTISPTNAQAHLWRADAIRQLAAAAKSADERLRLFGEAREGYREFLRLSNISNSLGSRLAFHFIGLGAGSRKHADRQAAFDSLRNAGFLGLCLTETKVGNLLRAREYCERGVKHAPTDPIGEFLLANVHRDLFNQRQQCGDLAAARQHYSKMLSLNDQIDEAKNARSYLAQIVAVEREAGC